jgi:hypothetical protein
MRNVSRVLNGCGPGLHDFGHRLRLMNRRSSRVVFQLRWASHLCLHAYRRRLRAIDRRRDGSPHALRGHGSLWLTNGGLELRRGPRRPIEWLWYASRSR